MGREKVTQAQKIAAEVLLGLPGGAVMAFLTYKDKHRFVCSEFRNTDVIKVTKCRSAYHEQRFIRKRVG